ncbi:MAG: response regulator transcription factor [Dehalococcoidales bacterium]|nr:response regulator transcription factor [Dehalococcoidales bacterium]
MKKIKVLIVDDHTLVRAGVRALLSLSSDIEVIGEASDGIEALEKIRQNPPDVVLMDLAMPVMGGLETTRRIKKEYPGIQVIVLTQYDDSEYVIPVIEAGARGFVTKMAAFSELATAIHTAYNGDSYLSSEAATVLVKDYQHKTSLDDERDPYKLLTDREKEVFKLVAEGHTAKEIASLLVVSPKTVEWYKTRLMNKLNIHNKTDLIRYAIRKRIILS